jgi:hypothetical protein
MVECVEERSLSSPDLIETLLGPLDATLRRCSLIESFAAEDFVDDDFLAAPKLPKNGIASSLVLT